MEKEEAKQIVKKMKERQEARENRRSNTIDYFWQIVGFAQDCDDLERLKNFILKVSQELEQLK